MTTPDNGGIRVKRVSRDQPAGPLHDDRADGLTVRSRGADVRETKPFYKTSEFLMAVAAIAGLLIFGYAGDDELDTWRTWLLVATVASAYILSRGIAKAGSSDRH